MTQLTIYDEVFKRNRPEPTRQETIDQLLKRADEREQEARFWQKHYNTLRATHLRQCAASDRSLAAMFRR